MMMDLVQEEQIVSQQTNVPFEKLLDDMDTFSPGLLADRYAEVCDGYMVLSLNGHRSQEQDLLLDKLDSTLHMLFGAKGMFVQFGRLMSILKTMAACADVFRRQSRDEKDLLLVKEAMTRCKILTDGGGLDGTLSVDADTLSEHFSNVSSAASALLEIESSNAVTAWLRRKSVARRALGQLMDRVVFRSSDARAMDAINALISGSSSSKDEISFIRTCYGMSGWISCLAVAMLARERLEDLAGLVREGLGA